MGCCGTVVKDLEIEQAVNMTELISIMNKKRLLMLVNELKIFIFKKIYQLKNLI